MKLTIFRFLSLLMYRELEEKNKGGLPDSLGITGEIKPGLPGNPGTFEDAMDRWSDHILKYQKE